MEAWELMRTDKALKPFLYISIYKDTFVEALSMLASNSESHEYVWAQKLIEKCDDLGLKVAAVAILAEDERVWNAMVMSGTPPPIDGLIGDAARDEWIRLKPERFEKLYGKVPPLSTANKSSDKPDNKEQ
jgi:hypothetical protein